MGYRETDIESIPSRHPVSAFCTHWINLRGSGGIPLRNQINPAEIAGILPWMLVLEALHTRNEPDFRYRLAGTGCTELFGIDYTGKMLGENLTPEGAEIRRREFARVMETEAPVLSTTNLPIKAKDFITVHRGVFPVSLNGRNTDQIFVVIAPVATECAIRPPLPT
ncbi:PAS domain-containing protein [Parvibaculum sp.]|uniref:PAS domain-containing protein n=3 Tax=Parvibaculum sp. TaxID=2024848 RepID=UPI001B06048A|nr:PAS domain-containing protein [Parvibaculum sp.]MBO6669294.1 PAS domain-containing protein [Parvibaculum sp.]MBO6712940.1 PAS domain-containing protein [Parvibaculum sp.]